MIDAEERASAAQVETNEAQIAVFETEPTTPAGAIALLRFIADFVDEDYVINDTSAEGILGDVIRRVVDILEREELA